jgi:hypothetical protein
MRRHEPRGCALRTPRVGGNFSDFNFHPALIPGNLVRTISGQGGCWCGNGVACFWATSLRKKLCTRNAVQASDGGLRKIADGRAWVGLAVAN